MKDLLELVRNRYKELNARLNAAKEEEAKYESIKETLAIEFNINDNLYEEACNHFERIEKRINNRKKEFIKKRLMTHKKIIISALSSIATITIASCMAFGAITNPLFLPIIGSFTIASLVDIKCSWKNIKQELEDKFENLNSTKKAREVSDRAYVTKLQREEECRKIQDEIINNTRNLNLAKAKRISIENEMMGVKSDAFNMIIDEKTDAESLVLRK
jgi:hypothetical protein